MARDDLITRAHFSYTSFLIFSNFLLSSVFVAFLLIHIKKIYASHFAHDFIIKFAQINKKWWPFVLGIKISWNLAMKLQRRIYIVWKFKLGSLRIWKLLVKQWTNIIRNNLENL